MKKITLALTMAMSLLGCGTQDEGRSAARLAKVELTTTTGGTTSIERIELGYEGSELTSMDAFRNGAPNGTARLRYEAGKIIRMDVADKDGDRAFTTFEYIDNYLWKSHYEVTGAVQTDRTVWYDEATAMVREQSFSMKRAGQAMPSTWLSRYEYDANQRIEKMLEIAGNSTHTTDVTYNKDGTIERSSSFSGAEHDETWNYYYLDDGRLDEILATQNANVFISYNDKNLMSEIRVLDGATTHSYRLDYEEGSVSGMTFAPLGIPLGGQFDLAGKVYSDVALLHTTPFLGDEIEHVGDDDDGGGDGVCFASNGTSCDACLQDLCCESCTTTTCRSFYYCAVGCTDSSCISACQSAYPGNDAFGQCGYNQCSAACAP